MVSEEKIYKLLNERATYVIANFNYSGPQAFEKDFYESDSIQELKLDLKPAQIKIEPNNVVPVGFPLPIKAYRINDSIDMVLSGMDRRLDLMTDKYSVHHELLDKLLLRLAQTKISDITAIGINYDAECNTGTKKLSIFNTKINDETIGNWSSNNGFRVLIPFNLEKYDSVATYTIQKIKGGNLSDKSFEEYVYGVSVNYNFVLKADKANLSKQVKRLEDIISYTDDLYKDFETKCKEITNLC
ncbi:hypothetical protein IJ541_08025 [bacterium]|nr:hypothetical protein [bacterium]